MLTTTLRKENFQNATPELGLSSALKEEIFASCVDQSKDVQEQKLGFDSVFQALQNQEKLSVELIRDFHRAFSPPVRDTRSMAPELLDDLNFPGKFRDTLVGSAGHLSKEVTKDILSIMKEEKEAGFQGMHGTLLAPLTPKGPNYKLVTFQGNLPSDPIAVDNLAEDIYQKSLSTEYVVLAPRTNNTNLPANKMPSRTDISSYLDSAIQTLVSNFNNDMANISDKDEKLQRIAIFIQRCMRLHPFRDCNHRTFTLGVLNFLLMSNGLGYCPLKDRKMIFALDKGVQESLVTIKAQLKPITLSEKEPNAPKEQILASADNSSAVAIEATPTPNLTHTTASDNTNTSSSVTPVKRKTITESPDTTLLPSPKRRNTEATDLPLSIVPKKIKTVDTGDMCYESSPCQHRITLHYNDGTQKKTGLVRGDDIATKYYPYLNKEDQQHFAEYLPKNQAHQNGKSVANTQALTSADNSAAVAIEATPTPNLTHTTASDNTNTSFSVTPIKKKTIRENPNTTLLPTSKRRHTEATALHSSASLLNNNDELNSDKPKTEFAAEPKQTTSALSPAPQETKAGGCISQKVATHLPKKQPRQKIQPVESELSDAQEPLYPNNKKLSLAIIVAALITNVGGKNNGRWTSGISSAKLEKLRDIQKSLDQATELNNETYQKFANAILAVCQIKRHSSHFWQSPHDVQEYLNLLKEHGLSAPRDYVNMKNGENPEKLGNFRNPLRSA